MPLAGTGAVIVWNDIAPELRDEFFEWHPRQHMPERLSLPGFIRGRRCIATGTGVEFLTLYEVRDLTVLDSEAYRTRLANPAAWSLKVMPGFRNNVRGGCRVEYTGGHVMGGFIDSLRLEAGDADARARLVETLRNEWLPGLLRLPRVSGVHLCVNDAGLSGGQVGARQGRFITQPDLVVLVEGSTAEGVTAASAHVDDDALIRLGAKAPAQRDRFHLEYSLQALEGVPRVTPASADRFERI